MVQAPEIIVLTSRRHSALYLFTQFLDPYFEDLSQFVRVNNRFFKMLFV